MAVTSGFFDAVSGDRVYNAAQMSEYFDGLVSDGVYESVGGALQVTAGQGMTVNVKSGRAIVGGRWVKNDATMSLSITAANPVLHRYSAVVMRLNLTARTIVITTKDGDPASAPRKPDMSNTDTIKELCLAYIYVPKGSTQIYQSNITDARPDNNVCGWVTGLIKQVDTSELFLQWQAAYEEFYTAFQSWFDTLTSELQVNTYLSQFEKYASGTLADLESIPLDMTGYTYEESDCISVYINGLAVAQGHGWTLDTTGATPEVVLTFSASSSVTNEVFIKVIKSKIGDPIQTGGDTFEPYEINNRSISRSATRVSVVPTPSEQVLNYWDFTESLTDIIDGEEATLNGSTQGSDGISMNYAYSYISVDPSLFQPGRAYEIKVKSMVNNNGNTHGRFFMWNSDNGFILRSGTTWQCYIGDAWGGTAYGDATDKTAFNDTVFRLEYTYENNLNVIRIYKDGSLFYEASTSVLSSNMLRIGASQQGYHSLVIESFKIVQLNA